MNHIDLCTLSWLGPPSLTWWGTRASFPSVYPMLWVRDIFPKVPRQFALCFNIDRRSSFMKGSRCRARQTTLATMWWSRSKSRRWWSHLIYHSPRGEFTASFGDLEFWKRLPRENRKCPVYNMWHSVNTNSLQCNLASHCQWQDVIPCNAIQYSWKCWTMKSSRSGSCKVGTFSRLLWH